MKQPAPGPPIQISPRHAAKGPIHYISTMKVLLQPARSKALLHQARSILSWLCAYEPKSICHELPTIQGNLGPHLDWVWSLIQPIKGSLIASQSFIIIKIELAIHGGNPAAQVKNGKR